MNTRQAKQLTRKFLEDNKLPFTKLTAKTVGFSDLLRTQTIFVKVHGWKPDPAWNALRQLAFENGFCVE